MKIRLSRISVPEIPASGRQRSGEVAQLTHLQPPALGLLGDQAGVPGVGPEEPGLGLLLEAPGQLVDVVTDHQTPKEKTIHSFKYVNDACLQSLLQPIKPK